MKKLKLLLALPLLLLTACGGKELTVSSTITSKWDRKWIQTIYCGKVLTYVPHHTYYFDFEEVKPYTKQVNQTDWNNYEIGDKYTFTIKEKEKEYFFTESIVNSEGGSDKNEILYYVSSFR